MLRNEALRSIRRGQGELARIRQQLASGKRVGKPSDDPVAVPGIMDSSSRLRAVEQYRRNLDSADARVRLEDSILQDLTLTIERARELAIGQGGDTASPATRRTVQAEIDELRDFVRTLGNTRFGNAYLFGGAYAQDEPFPPGGPDPLRPPAGDHDVEIGAGEYALANHGGQRIFIDTGIFDDLEALSVALGANDADGIMAAAEALDRTNGEVQELVGEIGARGRRLEIARENLESIEIDLNTYRSELEDVDFERAVTELASLQASFQAALAANARIFTNTLNDYLR
jgi:flagellar hook-associated protein 3 FlgL